MNIEQRLSLLEKKVGIKEDSSENKVLLDKIKKSPLRSISQIKQELNSSFKSNFKACAKGLTSDLGHWTTDYEETYRAFGVSDDPRFVTEEQMQELMANNENVTLYTFSFFEHDEPEEWYLKRWSQEEYENFYRTPNGGPITPDLKCSSEKWTEDPGDHWDFYYIVKVGKDLRTMPKSKILDKYIGKGKWTIDEKGMINVDGGVNLQYHNFRGSSILEKFGQFGKVTGDFNCSYCGLNTLEGCPSYVGGKFICEINELKDLLGGPGFVGSSYICSGNKTLVSLKGCPKIINGNFNCSGYECDLKSLQYCPEQVKGSFKCSSYTITNFRNFPRKIGKGIECNFKIIEDFSGFPKTVNGDLSFGNAKLLTLKGFPKTVNGNFTIFVSYETNTYEEEDIREISDISGTIRSW